MGKKVCLIDYENTALAGLDGLENLESGDGVRIICSNDSIGNTLLHILSIYRERNVTIEVEYMNQRGSNALDFRLSCDLGFFIAQGDVEQIYVVSRDKGYLHAISEASALNADVLIVRGVSIRDCLFKVEHGMTELPIEGFAEPCTEAEDVDAGMKLEWQRINSRAGMNKTSKALGILKQKMPVLGKGGQQEEAKARTSKKKTDKADKKKAAHAEKQPKAIDKKSNDKKPKAEKHGEMKKTQDNQLVLTNAQRKKKQQEIVEYIEKQTSLEANYAAHIAASVIKEPSVMDFRKAVKRTLGKKHEDYEAEAVGVYMHFRKN